MYDIYYRTHTLASSCVEFSSRGGIMRGKTIIVGFLAFSSFLLFVVAAESGSNRYAEDFTSKLYCDTLNTTAWWDTISGELKLPPFELTLAGSYNTPGLAMGVAVDGDYAYVADENAGLQVIDISDPGNPSSAGSYNTSGTALAVTIDGDYAYVADGAYGLQVIDISDPTIPSLAGNYDTPGSAYGVAVSGDYAYVADATSGLLVIDISNPTSPTLAGSYDTPGAALGVAVEGDYAYVADQASGLRVIDISDPTNPSLAGSYDTPGYALGVAIDGDHAYVADGFYGLQVIDIMDPTSPVLVGSYDTPSWVYGVAVCGDYLYAVDYSYGLYAIEISNPTSPSLAESLDTPGNAYGVAVSGEYAYVADEVSGLQVIDICEPVRPSRVGSCATPGTAMNGAMCGDYFYVADGAYGLEVIDISDPTAPSLVGNFDTPGYAYDVAIAGDHAYVADYSSGLQVINISDPTSPSAEGSYDTPSYAIDVSISGNYAYVADYGSGLHAIDITDPTSPSLAGSYNTPGYAWSVAIAGDYAYVADYSSGLQVIDISDPTNPELAGSCGALGNARGIAISGDYAYVAADGLSGLKIVDISDPAIPSLVGSFDTPEAAYGVDVSGDRACVACGSSGVQLIDISDPAAPSLAGKCDTPGNARSAPVSGDYAYVPDYSDGLQVIWIFQRFLDTESSTSQSVQINSTSDDIVAVRLSSTQADTVRWEVSADGGTDWQEVLADGSFNMMVVPGNDLRWRSSQVYSYPFVNPTCSHLVIDWSSTLPLIAEIEDIPNDQGKQLRVRWLRSDNDYAGSTTPITEYAIYRRIDGGLRMSPDLEGSGAAITDVPARGEIPQPPLAYPPGNWHFLATVPANCEDTYAAVVPTLADSTIAEGMYHTVFFVRARTASPAVYFDSPPDSGYSVDNLAPGVPGGFSVACNTGTGNRLSWNESGDEDFRHFCIYRGTSSDFTPSEENRVGVTAATEWADPEYDGWTVYYKITAVDFSGNESDPATPETVTGDDTPTLPRAFALYQNVPNPFNATTTIRFDLPVRSHGKLAVYNVKGELIRVLLDGEIEAGSREVRWDGRDTAGRAVASGIYFYRLDTPTFRESRKMILIR
jgi:hypothetical protein